MNTGPGATTHKDIIAGLTSDQRTMLLARSDLSGVLQLARHAGALALTGCWIALSWPGWPFVLVVHGILIVFLFTALHETVHETAFASRWLNRMVAVTSGFLLILPPRWFRAFHFAHHRHTNDPDHDPELAGPPIVSKSDYAWRLTGIPVWIEHVKGLVKIAHGIDLEDFVPDRAQQSAVAEARAFLASYLVLLAGSVVTGSTILLWLWIVPALFGQPFLRAYLMAEHTLCPHVGNMLINSRTTFTNRGVRALAWNMPFHAEHHSYPSVPFHKLPAFHEIIRTKLGTTAEGYRAFHTEVLASTRPGQSAVD